MSYQKEIDEHNKKIAAQEIAEGYRHAMIGKRYRHFKGATYHVDSIAVHSETNEIRVIYHSEDNPDYVWDREVGMFLSLVDKLKYPDAKQMFRFELLLEED